MGEKRETQKEKEERHKEKKKRRGVKRQGELTEERARGKESELLGDDGGFKWSFANDALIRQPIFVQVDLVVPFFIFTASAFSEVPLIRCIYSIYSDNTDNANVLLSYPSFIARYALPSGVK